MPNWCDNSLVVSGNAKDVAKFKKKAKTKKSDFSFQPFIPMAMELAKSVANGQTNPKMKKKYGYDNWYERNLSVLGTKWDVEGHLEGAKRTELVYGFDSAWSPPSAGVAKLSEMYPGLNFNLNYDEPSEDFAGKQTYAHGELIMDLKTKSITYAEDQDRDE